MIAASLNAAEINFEGLNKGDIVNKLTEGSGVSGTRGGEITVYGFNPKLSTNDNAAVIFDSANPTGGDDDLGTPNEAFGGFGVDDDMGDVVGGELNSQYENNQSLYNVLIINESSGLKDTNTNGLIDADDADVADPNDADLQGQFFEFDFSGLARSKSVTINSVSYLDIEEEEGESGARIELYGPRLPKVGKMISLNAVGDNGFNTIADIGIEGVTLMRIVMNGSGAVTGITFDEEPERPCWVTTGGFFNSGVVSGPKQCTFGGNVGPPPSGAFEVNFHSGDNDGDKFHTNDIEVVECLDMDSTGPKQPGGKKGFEIDTLVFECTGRFNNESGYTCAGYLLDSGEPQGKKDNMADQINMVISDAAGNTVAECTGEMDGGNVQIHPPVGRP
ncbi:hypothetical protein GCM10023333_31510 [Ferrimonas pelagia]|uniref:Uncharacterized protein n=2 Tax=Ferrimonas pelagia TaxID=1177826 RepID=A0ABP9F7P1_9GAMM